MKTTSRIAALGIAWVLSAATAWAGPRMELDPKVLKLGTMGQHEVVERDVIVRNLGDETLEIYELSTTCPCTFPEIVDEVIEPGGTGRIHVTFQTKTYQGDVHKIIEVYSNDAEESYGEIGIQVYVEAPVFVDPDDRKLDFGDVSYGNDPAVEASFRSGGGEALAIEVLDHNSSLFDCETHADGDGGARLIVKLRTDAPAGTIREIIRVGTDAAGADEIDLEVFGRVEAELMAEPDRLNFRMVAPEAELTREILLRSAGAPFSVTAASIDLAGLEVEILDAGPGQEARLRVHGRALGKDDEAAAKSRGRLKGKVKISTDHPAQPVLEVVVLYMLRI